MRALPESRSQTERQQSAIMAIHARYEANDAEYQRIDRAVTELRTEPDDHPLKLKYSAALKTLCREAEALRDALLYQVPVTWAEAMVLQFHIACQHDFNASMEGVPDADMMRLQTAIETLFDYLCCEINQERGAIGPAFEAEETRVFFNRRHRTGVLEEADA